MKAKLVQIVTFLGCAAMLHGMTAVAEDSDTEISLSAGVEFTSGTYGGDDDIEDTYIPLTTTIDNGRFTFRLTVPYMSLTAPEGTILDPEGVPLPGTGETVTDSGLGDITASVTMYDVIDIERLDLVMDLTGKIKFGTADVDKGFGTGENDYSVQADFFKFADQLTLVGSVGYKFRGDPTGYDLENVLMASVGSIYKFTPEVNGGLFFDYRESAINGNDSIQELTAFVSRRMTDDWRLQLYVLTGFTDSSPDWGGGIQIKRSLTR